MQLVIDINSVNSEQLTHVEAIIAIQRTKVLANEKWFEENDGGVAKVISNQPELPFGDEVIDTSKNEVPTIKKTRAKRTETASEPTETPKEVSEPTPEVIKAPDASETITIKMLKEVAQTLVQKVDRDLVKSAISKYADKLSDVKEEDYADLMLDFTALAV